MADEKGPYKVLSESDRGYVKGQTFAIICQKNGDNFFTRVVPNAGDASVARLLCNLLNKAHHERMAAAEEEAKEAGVNVEIAGTDGDGFSDPDQ